MSGYLKSDLWKYVYDIGPKKVPTVSTQEISVAVRVHRIRLINNTAGPINITVTDGQGTPLSVGIPSSFTLNPGGFLIYTNEKFGDLVPVGISWQASAPNLEGYIQATPA